MLDEVVILIEAAALLKLAEKTVQTADEAGEILAFMIPGQWRMKRTELDPWIDAQLRGSKGGGRAE